VALSGDGGDENFAGYSKYLVDQSEHKLRAFVPSLIGNKLFPALCSALDSTGNPLLRRGASRFHSLSLDAGTGFAVTNSFFRHSTWNALIANELKQESANYSSAEYTRQLYLQADTDDHLSRVLYTDLKSYLPGDILVKVDRMSMANSLETRAPLLDYRLVEFAASVPSHLKLANGHTKYLLKQCAASFLPAEVLTRRKRGFSVPLAQWLRADIKDIASEHLFSTNSGLSRFFDISMLKRIWQQHQSGRIDHSSELWSLLIFELWWQRTQVPDGSGT